MPFATETATLRQIAPISRSRLRSPASRVYASMTFSTPLSVNSTFASLTPFSSICFGMRWRRAIAFFSSVV